LYTRMHACTHARTHAHHSSHPHADSPLTYAADAQVTHTERQMKDGMLTWSAL